MERELKFYEFSQNNSGGSFITDDILCHRLFIEASSEEEAINKAEELGCYWDGVEEGSDCPCCGDRWYPSGSSVDLEKINKEGFEVYEYIHGKDKKGQVSESAVILDFKSNTKGEWLKEPVIENKYGSLRVAGKLRFNSIEDYAQLMADKWGWTKPDARIFYKNGEVKEIFSRKIK